MTWTQVLQSGGVAFAAAGLLYLTGHRRGRTGRRGDGDTQGVPAPHPRPRPSLSPATRTATPVDSMPLVDALPAARHRAADTNVWRGNASPGRFTRGAPTRSAGSPSASTAAAGHPGGTTYLSAAAQQHRTPGLRSS